MRQSFHCHMLIVAMYTGWILVVHVCKREGELQQLLIFGPPSPSDPPPDIENSAGKLKGQPVFTRDFARMYTSLPQVQLKKEQFLRCLPSTAKRLESPWIPVVYVPQC